MGTKEKKIEWLMQILSSPSSSSETDESTSSSDSEKDDGSPIRSIFCLKKNVDMELFEAIHDCFILDFDPSDSLHHITTLSVSSTAISDDVSVVAEKGQVACRDYPHSRHLCLKFSFDKTPHETHCELCYCYVCDSAAPCEYWKDAHCHAAEHIGDWKFRRALWRK